MYNKKGISEVIAYVLMVALAVALGTFIAVWYKSTVQTQVSGILNPIEGSSQCDEINVNLVFNYATCGITVYNTGTLNIDALKITYSDNAGGLNNSNYEVKIPPRLNQPIDLPIDGGIVRENLRTVIVIPIVTVDKQSYYCSRDYMFNALENFIGCP